MERGGFNPELRRTVFTALTGRAGDVSGRRDGDVRGMLLAIGGPSARTRSGIDLSAAARELGVTRRTVERWVTAAAERTGPAGKNLANLVTKSRQVATTQRGRRAALAGVRGGPMSRQGAKLSIRGEQGPRRAGKDYRRFRKIDLILPPEAVESLLDAYEAGGDKAFVGWLEEYADQEYLEDWGFDTITDLDVGGPDGNG